MEGKGEAKKGEMGLCHFIFLFNICTYLKRDQDAAVLALNSGFEKEVSSCLAASASKDSSIVGKSF